MRYLICLLLALLPELGGTRLSAGEDRASSAYHAAYALMLDAKWAEAKIRFQDFLKRFPKSKWAEESQYWLCMARDKLGEPADDVYACYAEFIDKYPNGEWAKQASANLMMLSFRRRELHTGGKEVPLIPQTTSKDEDTQIASLFTMQASDTAAALREAARLYDASRNEPFRSKLVYVLGSFRTPEAALKLGQIMRTDPSPSIRSDALTLLANTRMPTAYTLFRDLVNSAEPAGLKEKALRALLQVQMPGTDTLCYRIALQEQSQTLAELAALGLARMGRTVEPGVLRTLLKKGKYPEVREIGFYALAGLTRNALSQKALRELADSDPDPVIRLSARKLTRMGPDTLRIVQAIMDVYTMSLSFQPGGIVWFFTRGFGELGFRDILLWPACAAPEEQVASAAFEGLRTFLKGNGGTEYAKVAVFSKFTWLKKAALKEITALKAPASITIIDSVLRRETDAGVRYEAIQALAVQQNDSAAAPLLEAARHDVDGSVRSAAVAALGRMHTQGAEEALKELEKQ